ncbi:MAG: glycosyltransferase family 4 protein [Kineosporiaceae bacterium]
MRVGLVSAYALDVPGGVQDQVLGLARRLSGAGHEVTVLAPGPSVAGSTSAGPVVAVPGNGSVARLALAVGRARVTGWATGLDVVHLHEPLAPGLPQAVLRAAAAGGPPVVATGHACSDSPLLTAAAPVLRRRLRAAARVTAVSRHAAATLARIGVGSDDLVPNAVHVPGAMAEVVARGRGAGERPTVVAVGRLAEPRKGIDVLLAAWPAVRRSTGAELLLVGPGRPRGGRALPEGARAVGRVPEAERDALVAAAAVVVAPHLGGESFGLVVAEAMARGRPVVASALPAFADLLAAGPAGGAAGLLVPPGEPGPLADALLRVLLDPALGDRVGAAGRVRAAGLAWEVVVPRYLEVYRRAVTTAIAASRGMPDPSW